MLINTDGLAILGPGSEWLWSMLQFVIVAITLIAIYRQLRLQGSAAAMQQMDALIKDWRSEEMTRHTLAVEISLRGGINPTKIPYGAASSIADFWEGIGYLVRKGHIDEHLLGENLGHSVQWWWAALRSWALKIRTETLQQDALEHFEWLAARMAELDQRAGNTVVYDDAHVAATVERRIENDSDRVRVAEDLRSVPARNARRRPA